MTGVRNRIGLVVVLLLILIPAVYVLADEAYIDTIRGVGYRWREH